MLATNTKIMYRIHYRINNCWVETLLSRVVISRTIITYKGRVSTYCNIVQRLEGHAFRPCDRRVLYGQDKRFEGNNMYIGTAVNARLVYWIFFLKYRITENNRLHVE